jgi:hypothetical protein
MKTKNFITFVAITIVFVFILSECRTKKADDFPLFSLQDSAYILTRDSTWIKTVKVGNKEDMLCDLISGFGPAVKIKIFRAGTLREVYRRYYTGYNDETYQPTDSIMNLEIRARQVQPGEYWVIAATDTYLDDRLIRINNDGNQYYGSPTPEEINDPVWTPKNYLGTFTSLRELNDYAQKSKSWMVICSKQTTDLLGWEYKPTECFILKIAGKSLPVLKIKSWDMNEEVEWGGTHIHYRYLCISWGGHDIECGPGISAFNVNNSSSGSIDDSYFVKINCHNGKGYYFDEEVKGFSLKTFEGI